MISDRTIGRLSLYRRLLRDLLADGERSIYSHQLAAMAGGTAAQVRRDIMSIGYSGSPVHGYDVERLLDSIGHFLDASQTQNVALVGVGNLGRALLAYFVGRHPTLSIVAAFDSDPGKANRVIHGCRCYPIDDMKTIAKERDIRLGIIAVPAPEAQSVSNLLVQAGVRGLLNFAPLRLWVPEHVYVENLDVTMSLEKVAYFARQGDLDSDKEATS
jgi:redox-sensing transcriptional repressor